MKRLIVLTALLFTVGVTASAQMIGATNNQQTPRVQRVDNSPLFRPTGGSLRFSVGIHEYLELSYNHYLTSTFMVGVGSGFGTYYGMRYDSEGIPIFVETELRTPKFKWSLFVNIKAGYCFIYNDIDVTFASFLAGISYKNINLGFGASTLKSIGSRYFKLSFSYNLPLSTIERWFFK